jgi:hypothetical protein
MIITIPTYMREDNQKCLDGLPENIKNKVTLFTHSGRAEILRSATKHDVIDMGSCDGIADVRQKLIDHVKDNLGVSKVFIMDDGCKFKKRVDMKLVDMEESDYIAMFNQVEGLLDKYPMVGISDQAGNNRVEEDLQTVGRSYSCYGVNIDMLRQNNIRFDAMYQDNNEIKLYEDFHLILDILTKGFENAICYNYAFSHAHGKKGGNSTMRTNELQKKCLLTLSERYPGLVKLVKKENPSWKAGLDDSENFRWEAQLSWKKAWEIGQSGGFSNSLEEFF